VTDEPYNPSLENELMNGRDALSQIHMLGPVAPEDCRVCFHFACPGDEKNDRWGDEAECVRNSQPMFEAMPFKLAVDGVGGTVGIEAWEVVYPTVEWLEDRLPRMIDVARRSGMQFLGWSFEPVGHAYVSAGTGLNVVNANTPAGSDMIEKLIEDAGNSRKETKH
jgi:hypothetical protein